jgi:hypothetical protein
MFYKKEEVDLVMLCSICSDFFQDNDPRMLPCGESACHRCIKSASDANNEFKCLFCEEQHKPSSEKGFPPNLALLKLIKTKANEVYRNSNVKKLNSKLAEGRQKSDDLKANFENGTDQVKEHCIKLRNRVHLETEILIEQAHQFNEQLIAEIDKYEQECLDAFNKKTSKYENECMQFLTEVDRFYLENAKYLTQFKIDEKKIENGLALAETYIEKLQKEDLALRMMKFDGQLMEFKKNEDKPTQSLVGSLTKQQLSPYFGDVKQVRLSSPMKISFMFSNLHLFKLENEQNVGFYIIRSLNFNMSMLTFDNLGQVVGEVQTLFTIKLTQMKVVKFGDNYVINVQFVNTNYSSCLFQDQTISLLNRNGSFCQSLLLIVNAKLKYINHQPLDSMFRHMVGNSSQLLCIDSAHKLSCYDMKLNVIQIKELNKVQADLLQTTVDVEMNETYLFVICSNRKLKIFDLNKFDLVKEIDVNANKMKLASTRFLVLFCSTSRVMYLFDQCGDFALHEKISLAESIDAGLTLARDTTKFVSFYNESQIKYISVI